MAARQGNARSPYRYCGARLWVDHSKALVPLRERLYEYWGPSLVEGKLFHKFFAYRHKGGNFAGTDEHLLALISENKFKPFILDCVELGFVKQQGEYTDGPA